MIEHYALHTIGNITDRFGLRDGVPKGIKPRYNISPVQPAPVIINDGDKKSLELMTYGLVPTGAKDANSVFRYKTYNVKSEKIFAKPAWEHSIKQQRCIIPMNGFFMQRSGKDGDVYYFNSHSNELLGGAGIYTSWTDPEGVSRNTFALLTIEANDAMPLPFARMPVFIHRDDESQWFDKTVQDVSSLIKMMRPYEGQVLQYTLVNNSVLSAKIDDSSLLDPAARAHNN